MRVLGIDPGSRQTGWGCLDLDGSRQRLVAHGRISCRTGALTDRLLELGVGIREVLDRWRPDAAVLESPFRGVNPRSLIVLAQARGALLLAVAESGCPIHEFSPAEVKSAVTGSGRADKTQVGRMVAMLLGVAAADLSEDSADALAVALCFAARRPFRVATAPR